MDKGFKETIISLDKYILPSDKKGKEQAKGSTIDTLRKEIREKAIDDLAKMFRLEFEEQMSLGLEDCINWADWLDEMAIRLKNEE